MDEENFNYGCRLLRHYDENGHIIEGYTSNHGVLMHTLDPFLQDFRSRRDLDYYLYRHNNSFEWNGDTYTFMPTINITDPLTEPENSDDDDKKEKVEKRSGFSFDDLRPCCSKQISKLSHSKQKKKRKEELDSEDEPDK